MSDRPGEDAPKDKREAIKWLNRRAIVMAAGELADAHGIKGVTVNDLAKRAGVSRRTIFNHFSSAEDAVYEYLSELISELLGTVLDNVPRPRAGHEAQLGEVYRDLIAATQASDLLGALHPLLAHVPAVADNPSTALWGEKVTAAATDRVEAVLRERLPRRDRFELRVVASTLINTIALCVAEWTARTDGHLNHDTQGVWDHLFETALHVLGQGLDTGNPGAGTRSAGARSREYRDAGARSAEHREAGDPGSRDPGTEDPGT